MENGPVPPSGYRRYQLRGKFYVSGQTPIRIPRIFVDVDSRPASFERGSDSMAVGQTAQRNDEGRILFQSIE